MTINNRKLLFKDKAVLLNGIGKDSYEKTELKNIFISEKTVTYTNQNIPIRSFDLYYFDAVSSALSQNGIKKKYIEPEMFEKTDMLESFFTFRFGIDRILPGIANFVFHETSQEFVLSSVKRYDAGTKRVHHWKCEAVSVMYNSYCTVWHNSENGYTQKYYPCYWQGTDGGKISKNSKKDECEARIFLPADALIGRYDYISNGCKDSIFFESAAELLNEYSPLKVMNAEYIDYGNKLMKHIEVTAK